MTKFKSHSWVIPISILFSVCVFILDSFSALGTADFIFYFLPVALTIFSTSINLPIYIAAGTTFLSAVGFYISPRGIDYGLGLQNRIYAFLTVWAVAYLVKRIIRSKNESDRFSWIKNGMAELALVIRGELTLEEIGKKVLTFLSSYTGATMGSAYIVSEKKDILYFMSGYALNESLITQELKMGQGLLGQAAEDGEVIELQDVKPDFHKVTSSLLEATPEYVLILPLKTYEEVVSVLEISFLKKPSPLVKEFLMEMSEMVAVAIRSSQHKVKLAELLNDSQQLSEELQAQQEELRVTNEELEQQTRALKDSYTKMENQQAELEQTNQQLEEQTQILENQKNLMNERNKDLTQTQMSLLEKTKELESASNYKSEFLANMSHELRTPLNSSLILAKLLAQNKNKNLTEEQVKYAEIIYSSGNDLLNIINDILDLSKVEAGKLTIEPERMHVKEMCQSLEQVFNPLAKQKNLGFSIMTDPSVPQDIYSDRMRLEQILKNFLSNAIKFTKEGEVKLEVSADKENVFFKVTDTGIGIAPHQKDVIFEAFRQADGTTNRQFGGTGLGLSISRELSRLLHGNIQVESTPGKGSSFILTVPKVYTVETKSTPAQAPAIAPTTAPPEAKLPERVKFSFEDDREKISPTSRKILIIEDDEPFAKILYDLAREGNFQALVASTASEGLWLTEKYLPQAILLDIRLPDHNGLLVLDQLKMNPRTRHIPVHILSSSDFSKSALEMGAMGYMLKPVKREKIQEAFQHLTSLLSKKMKHVLVVEDDEVQKEHITQLISGPDILVEAVGTAAEALEKLSKKTYDCMVMDLSLPDLTGHELLDELIRENSQYSYPPVIIYTARDLTREEEEKLRKYSGSIIIKGAKSPERLLNEVTLFLHRVETELPPERQKMLKDLRSREKTLENRKILIVDDDIRNIFALTSVLESFSAQVVVARNGLEALDKLETEEGIEVVLMDIMMPIMDGHEATQKIRLDKRFKNLPIIALTAKAMKDDQEKCLAAGANDYMAKPIDTDKLISLIRVWLPSKRSFIS